MFDTLPFELLNIILKIAGSSSIIVLSHINTGLRTQIQTKYSYNQGFIIKVLCDSVVFNNYVLKHVYRKYSKRLTRNLRDKFNKTLIKHGSIDTIKWCPYCWSLLIGTLFPTSFADWNNFISTILDGWK